MLETLGKIGVDLFVLITGYYSLNAKPKLQKVFQLTNKVRLYSFSIFVILIFYGQIQFGPRLLISALTPTLRFVYWFITIYVILYLCSGYLAILIKSLNKSQVQKLILFSVLIFMVIPTFLLSWDSLLTDLIPVFFLGLYIRIYQVSDKFLKFLKIGSVLSIVFILFCVVIADSLSLFFEKEIFITSATRFIVTESSPLAFILAAYIFSRTVILKARNNKLINWAGGSALAIYLIQDYEPFRPVLWENIFHVRAFTESMVTPIFMIYSILVIIVIVVGAILIDKFLNLLLSRPALLLLALEMKVTHYTIQFFKRIIVKLTGYQPNL
ncbi:hypothetical protein A9176_08325 [Leuconostoc garlicum]|uniref:Acyltransferase 3 domain-containing protein n=2 Tax=Leuconostoc garlicum TaxID=255248 RepID=A0ABM6HVF5_9LACO|nr:acyltransferase family protein [Leuconostoc garlicum]AQN80351.1 hypothetical protein A9176_08325 [Leuconostoc garlicum]